MKRPSKLKAPRARSARRSTTVHVKPATKLDAAPPARGRGLVPATVERTSAGVRVDLQPPLEPGNAIDTTTAHSLASQLASELQALFQELAGVKVHGLRGDSVRERLAPVLDAYAEVLRGDADHQLACALAELAWAAVLVQRTPSQVLESAKKARGQASWAVPNDAGTMDAVDAQHIANELRAPRRGPRPDPLKQAGRVYRWLAWDSRADVQPTDDGRDSKMTVFLREYEGTARLRETLRNKSSM